MEGGSTSFEWNFTVVAEQLSALRDALITFVQDNSASIYAVAGLFLGFWLFRVVLSAIKKMAKS